ncbi:hypothetical protein HK096_000708, partial [Nowakowskiella sp. JEL0078]
IQADLKTFTALGVYGTSVLTALTAQNTRGVQSIHACPTEFVEVQLVSVLDDIGADIIKTGMLFNAEIIELVYAKLNSLPDLNLVVDPVMVSTSGHRLLASDAIDPFIKLISIATVITPNISEAEILSGDIQIHTIDDMRKVAIILKEKGCKYVLLKGGHLPMKKEDMETNSSNILRIHLMNDIEAVDGIYTVDILYDGEKTVEYWKPYFQTDHTHGTGCTLSAALAAYLAKGIPIREATEFALTFVAKAILHGVNLGIGHGHGPLNHLYSISEIPFVSPNSFPRKLVESCLPEWNDYIDHPFVKGIADGTLPAECFKHFIKQDYLYLIHYARGYALAAYKEHEFEEIASAADVVLNIYHESKLHIEFCKQWGVSLEELKSTNEATANLSYSRYFLEKGLSGDKLDLYVAMAPCLIGYGI